MSTLKEKLFKCGFVAWHLILQPLCVYVCVVDRCCKPRHRTDFCFRHRQVVEGVPFAVRLAVQAAKLAARLFPCDMVDFLHTHEVVHRDMVASIVLAMLKEPKETDEFLMTPDVTLGRIVNASKPIARKFPLAQSFELYTPVN